MRMPQEDLLQLSDCKFYAKKRSFSSRHPDSDRNRNARPCQGQGLHPCPQRQG